MGYLQQGLTESQNFLRDGLEEKRRNRQRTIEKIENAKQLEIWGDGVAVGHGDGVDIILPGVSGVDSVAGIPCLGVHGADLSEGLVVLGDDVSVDESADVGVLLGGKTLGNVKGRSRLACGGAKLGVEVSGEQLVGDVGVDTVVAERSVDCSVAERNGVGEAGGSDDAAVHVSVAAGHDNLEVIAPLAVVDSVGGGDGAGPEDTLDDCLRRGVGVLGGGIGHRVALEVDVDGSTSGNVVAVVGALDGVVLESY